MLLVRRNVMSSGGAGGANIGCTGAGNTAGVTGGAGVKTCGGQSEANFTYWPSTWLLSEELFFKFADSLLGDRVVVLILNTADID